MPTMSTAALVPFPHQAGAAAAMLGFLQMGAGLVAGAAMGDPLLAMALLIPFMGFCAVFFYRMYLREERHLAAGPIHRTDAAPAPQPQA
jgi:MFS transporter, DHA1 family, multidrug resistance protein